MASKKRPSIGKALPAKRVKRVNMFIPKDDPMHFNYSIRYPPQKEPVTKDPIKEEEPEQKSKEKVIPEKPLFSQVFQFSPSPSPSTPIESASDLLQKVLDSK